MLPKCRANFMRAIPSRIERRVRSAPSKAIMAHGDICSSDPTLRILGATKDMAMKLGLAIGSGAHLDVPVALPAKISLTAENKRHASTPSRRHRLRFPQHAGIG